MKFVIANTFQKALQRLEGKDAAEAKLAKQAAFDFQMNPSQSGFSFERLNKSKDPNFWSLRVNDNIRIIVHRVPDIQTLCYVDRLAADIAHRLGANGRDLRQTVTIKLNLDGKPLNIEVAGLYEIAKPAFKELLFVELEKINAKATTEMIDNLSQKIETTVPLEHRTVVAEILGKAMGNAVSESLAKAMDRKAELGSDILLASVAERLEPGIGLNRTNDTNDNTFGLQIEIPPRPLR